MRPAASLSVQNVYKHSVKSHCWTSTEEVKQNYKKEEKELRNVLLQTKDKKVRVNLLRLI